MSIVSIKDYKSRILPQDGVRILVVDDQSTSRLILQRMLESAGYTVVTAASGKEALQKLADDCFTIVLLDYIMPEMNGMEVLQKLREYHSPTELPVIMVSMNSNSKEIIRALSLGANDYIVKPYDFNILKARMEMQIDLKRKEAGLRDKEEQFRKIFENAPIGMAVCDQAGNILRVNRAVCEMVGYTENELLGKNYLQFTHPDDITPSRHNLQQLCAGEVEVYRLEKRYRHKQGHYIWVEITVTVILDAEAKPAYLIEQTQEITARKAAAEALVKNREELEKQVRIRTEKLSRANADLIREIAVHTQTEETLKKREMQLLEAQQLAHLGFWERDIAADQVFWSDEIFSILGVDPQNYRPRPGAIDDFVHPDDLAEFIEKRQTAMQGDLAFNHQFRIIRPDGELRTLHGCSKLHLDADGKVRRSTGTIIDITEASRMTARLSYQETHDPLTGLVNRKIFEKLVEDSMALRRIIADEFEHVICYLCIDQLKLINDTYGQVAGDELLVQLSQNLRQQLRKQDTLARLAGNRFGILMEHCNLSEAQRVLDEIRKSMDEFEFVWMEKHFNTTVSLGVVPVRNDASNLIEILARADLACDAAKEHGGNGIHIHTEDDGAVVLRHEQMRWVERINQALRDDRLQLYYQPIVSINDKFQEQHYELLIRMTDSDGTIIMPGDFLPAAERYNLSSKLDRWVITTALNWLEQHSSILDENHCWGINLSGQSLTDEYLLEFVIGALAQRQISPRKIYFEITETAAIANFKNAIRFITAMQEHGVRFALDDFGSGLSSFAYLKNMPVDFLKIDGMFVREIAHSDTDYAMVKAINDVGKSMNKLTIAEFVEDAAIISRLREIGVDFAQGYGICKPKPLAEYSAT